jgi:hypothetical protein
MPEPYNVQEVKKRAKELEDQPGFRDRNTQILEQRSLRFGQKAVNHPRISPTLEVRSLMIDQHIGLYVARLDQARLTLDVTPKDNKEEEQANRCKQYWMRSYVQMDRAQLEPPSLVVQDRQVGDGIGWYRIRLSPLIRDNIKVSQSGNVTGMEKGIIGVPFILETPDPVAVYHSPKFDEVAEIGFLTSAGVRSSDTTLEQLATTAYKEPKRVIRLETAEYVYDITYGDEKQTEAEIFTFHPNWFGAPGYVPVLGRVTGDQTAARRYRALVAKMYPLIERKNLYDTMQNNAADLTGAPLFFLRKGGSLLNKEDILLLPAPTSERTELKIDTGTGKVEVPEGYEPVPLSLTAGIDLIRAMEQLNAELADAGFPAMLTMPQEVHARSGYDRAVMERSTATYIVPPLTNHARAWENIFIRQGEAIKRLGISVTIRTVHQKGERELFEPVIGERPGEEVTVTPDDFIDVDLEAGFSSDTRESRIALQEEGMRLLERNLLSETEFFKDYRGVEDPERARELRDRDERRTIQRQAANACLKALLAEQYGEVLAEDVGGDGARRARRRPPKGEAVAGVGATLVQPGVRTPMGGEEPPLGGVEG